MTEKLPPNLPTLQEVRQTIEACLIDDSWSDCRQAESAEMFLERMRAKLGILAHAFVLLIRPDIPSTGQRFYRLRLSNEPLNEGLLSEYGPPPVDRTGFDRCNISKHPVMYCSANPGTTFRETLFIGREHVPHQFGYLSEWQVREGCTIGITPFVFSELSESSELHELVSFARGATLKRLLEHYPDEVAHGALKTMDYLSKLFLNDGTRSISSFIAHSHLYANHPSRPDMFMYPSVQANQLKANFAVHPNSLHKLEMTRVLVCEIRDYEPSKEEFNITWTTERHNHDGVLDRRLIPSERDRILTEQLVSDLDLAPQNSNA